MGGEYWKRDRLRYRRKGFDKKYWEELKDTQKDAAMDFIALSSMNFSDAVDLGEAAQEYATNLYLYGDAGERYLYTDSFYQFDWLDVRGSVINETFYHINENFSTVFLVSILICYMGFFFTAFIYILFAISGPVLENELDDGDLQDYRIVEPAIIKHANRKVNARIQALKGKAFQDPNLMEDTDAAWGLFTLLVFWPNSRLNLEDIVFAQLGKSLGRLNTKKRTDRRAWLIESHDIHSTEYVAWLSACLCEYAIYNEKKRGEKSLKKINGVINFQRVKNAQRLEKFKIINNGNIRPRHMVLDYELHVIDIHALNWHYFQGLSPFKLKKNFYIL